MPHPTFAPAELTISYSQTPAEDFDHHETLEVKKRTSMYHFYVPSEDAHERGLEHKRRLFQKLGLSFFLFGLINNGELLMANSGKH